MDKKILTNLQGFLCLQPSRWMMTSSEKLTVFGMLNVLRPKRVLELGCAEAGQTLWLSQYAEEVVTVDVDAKVLEVTKNFSNVRALWMTTRKAMELIKKENLDFDLTIIDADHSKEGVQHDLEHALRFSEVVILHDTYYPPCREGMLAVLRGHNIYYDLDLVAGGIQADGLWGGLGIVIPQLSKMTSSCKTVHQKRKTLYFFLYVWWRAWNFKELLKRIFAYVVKKAARIPNRIKKMFSQSRS